MKIKVFLFGFLLGIILTIIIFSFIDLYNSSFRTNIYSLRSIQAYREYEGLDYFLKVLIAVDYKNIYMVKRIEFLSRNEEINKLVSEVILEYKKSGNNIIDIEMQIHSKKLEELIVLLRENDCFLVIHEKGYNSPITHLRVNILSD